MKWQLTDRDGNAIAEFYNRRSSRVDVELNSRKTATISLSIYDEFADKIIALQTLLKCFYGDRCIYAGPVVVPNFDFDGGTVEITSFDTYFLERAFIEAQTVYTGVEHTTVVANLLALAQSPSPLTIPGPGIEANLPFPSSSTNRTQTYEPGQQIWAGITDLASILNAPDFSITPVDRTDGVWGQFNMHYPRRGSDKTDSVIFEYGTGRNNCTGFKWGPSGESVRNKQIVVGQAQGDSVAPTQTWTDLTSQQKHGIIENYEGSFGSPDSAIVLARAQELIAAYKNPPDFFTVQPAIEGLEEKYGVPPRVFEDYDVGDTVQVIAKRGNLTVAATGRISALSLEEATSAGDVRVTLTCQPTVPQGGLV